MPTFSHSSLVKLYTCDRRLVDLCTEVIKKCDFTILCGHRNREEQNQAFKTGHSRLQWPNSKHNTSPSQAIDLAPYPINWGDINRFRELNFYMHEEAEKLGIKISWGGDFVKLKDYGHWELSR